MIMNLPAYKLLIWIDLQCSIDNKDKFQKKNIEEKNVSVVCQWSREILH